MNHVQKGFTLIEIMIVVAIIAILAAIAIPNFIQYRQTAQVKACAANINVLNSATEAYIAANPSKKVSATDTTVDALYDSGKGPLKSIPTCPLEGSYTYNSDSNGFVCSHTDPTK